MARSRNNQTSQKDRKKDRFSVRDFLQRMAALAPPTEFEGVTYSIPKLERRGVEFRVMRLGQSVRVLLLAETAHAEKC